MTKPLPLAIIGCDSPSSFQKKLSELGFKVLILPADERLQSPVRSHADMLLCVINETVFCSKKYFLDNPDVFNTIEDYGYTVRACNVDVCAAYPGDVAFNMLYTKDCLIGKVELLPKEIKSYIQEKSITPVRVKQGYAKCSSLLLGNGALICADAGLLAKARELGLDTLKIENSPEAILLDGYDYGFIGGASGVFDKKIYLAGNLRHHPQGNIIEEFCKRNGYETVSLGEERLCDVGGIILLPSRQ